MNVFALAAVFIFGSIVGSFLNVCIYRLPRDKSLLTPRRSYCPHCHEPIAWHDNIPLVSYFLLRAQCRRCGFPISARYVIVEFITAALFVVTYAILSQRGESLPVVGVYMALMAVLVMGSFVDVELRIIPNVVTVGGMLAAPVLSVLVPQLHQNPAFGRMFVLWKSDLVLGPLAASLTGMAVGAAATWSAGIMGKVLFRREAMGFGDVKLMAMLGGLLGWPSALMIFFIAPFFGAAAGAVHLLRTREHHIPYVPFLSLAAAIVIFWGDRILATLGFARFFN